MRFPLSAKPLDGELVVTSPFGNRTLRGEPDFHPGVDFRAPEGTPLYAPCAGIAHTYPNAGGAGNMVSIEGPGGWTVNMDHLSQFAFDGPVEVDAGDLVGWSGSTGNVTGPHLHMELRPPPVNGQRQPVIDPLPYITGASFLKIVLVVGGIAAAAGAALWFWR